MGSFFVYSRVSGGVPVDAEGGALFLGDVQFSGDSKDFEPLAECGASDPEKL